MLQHIYASKSGEIQTSSFIALGRAGDKIIPLNEINLIELPPQSNIFLIPKAISLVKDKNKNIIELKKFKKNTIYPLAGVLPPGYLRILFPAYKKENKSFILPLFGYSAIARKDEKILTASLKIDDDYRWNPSQFNSPNLKNLIKENIKKHPSNRLLKHLAGCAIKFNCYTAQNIFYKRWEGALPTTSYCNASCLGCISFQEKIPSCQGRINFTPLVEEIVEIGSRHLTNKNSILSFGQGCEGEPSLNSKLISKAIKRIKKIANMGRINMNTNALIPSAIKELALSGLDSIRVSLNSVIDSHYKKYFRVKNVGIKEVKESIKIAGERGLRISLNLLVLPGLTDDKKETEELLNFVDKYPIDTLLLRNLNIDPDYYYQKVKQPSKESMGIENWLKFIKKNIKINIKSFNP